MNYCTMCGATEAMRHHDPSAKGKTVTLHRVTIDID